MIKSNNNVVKNVKTGKMKVEKIDREEKMERLESRKQARRTKNIFKYDREDWRK